MELNDTKSSLTRGFASPLAVAITVTLLLFLVGHPHYDTNDDMAIIALLSGKLGLEARPDGIFMSLPLSGVFYFLYSKMSYVPWYGISLYSFLFTGLYFGLKTIEYARLSSLGKLFVSLCLIFFYMPLFYKLNFTSVALFMWFGVMGYIACLNLNDVKSKSVEIWIGFALGAAYLVRPSIIYIAMLLSLPIYFTFFINFKIKRLIYTATPLVLLMFLSLGLETVVHSNPQYQQYEELCQIRSNFFDTQNSALLNATPENWRQVGWSDEDYILATGMWFHDSNIYNLERFRSLIDRNSDSSVLSINYLLQSGANHKVSLFIVLLCCTVTYLSVTKEYHLPKGREGLIRNLCMACFLVTLVAAFVLAGIRFPDRVAIPIMCFITLMFISLRPFIPSRVVNGEGIKRYILAGSCFIVMCFVYSNYARYETEHSRRVTVKNYTEQYFRAAQEINGPGTTFIYSNANDYCVVEFANPLKEYKDVLEIDLLPMGWLLGTPAYDSFLSKKGFVDRTAVVPSMVDNDRAVLCIFNQGNSFDGYSQILLRHLHQHYGQLFPGKSFQIEVLPGMEKKDMQANQSSWVFFKIVSAPLSSERKTSHAL